MENNYSLSDIAAASGENGFGSNWVLILLFAMIFGNNGFGNGGGNAARAEDIQRAVDLNSIQQGQAGISADIQRGIYEVNGATKDSAYNNLSEIRDLQSSVNAGNANIINNLTAMTAQMQNCCCETKSMILENRYLAEKNTSAILMDNAQNRMADMQQQISQLQTQLAMSGVPRISSYAYGVYPNMPMPPMLPGTTVT